MSNLQIACDHNTEHTGLIELAEPIVTAVESATSKFCESARINSLAVTFRITDNFRNEVEEFHSSRYPNYTTNRAGGEVGAITLSKEEDYENKPLILFNSSVFDIGTYLGVASFVLTLGHELGHCIIGQVRTQFGFPRGYCKRPENLIECISYTALSVSDEFLADALANKLLPTIKLSETTEAETKRTPIRDIYANTWIDKMYDDLSTYVYPAWKDTVQKYHRKKITLDDMTTSLATAVQEGLILDAHYRAAVTCIKNNIAEIEKIEQHPAMQLYLTPFWESVGPNLSSLLERQSFNQFHEMDQEIFDSASEAIEDIWETLGIEFELLPSGQVYVHVYEPLQA